MDTKRDAYGHAVWAFFQGKATFEIIERDDGFVDCALGAGYFAPFTRWPAIQRTAIKLAKGTVLDVGAGAGRVSLYLQERGLDVVAIDNSPLAIKVCKRRGVKRARLLPFERISVCKPGTFDTIVLFGNNFGLFGSAAKAKRLLRTLHRITTPDARIIAESADPYKTKDPAHLAYHTFNTRRPGRLPGQLRLRVRFREYVGPWFDYLFVSRKEMERILTGTGWRIERVIDSGKHSYIAVIGKRCV